MKTIRIFALLITVMVVSGLSCRLLSPKTIAPDSFEAKVAEGNITFTGSGNITYLDCQDPTAVVSIMIGPKTRTINDVEYKDNVNPVTISALTNGTMVRIEECQRSSAQDKHNWPAVGVYFPKEGVIKFRSCSGENSKADGQVYLVGEGFEGEYACYDADGDLMYKVALSTYGVSP